MNFRPKQYILLGSILATAVLGYGGLSTRVSAQSATTGAPASDFILADYMNDVVMSAANVIWESAYPDSGPNGEEILVGPKSEADWQNVRNAAQNLVDASTQLQQLPSGWLVRDPGVDHETPTSELAPEAIADLIRNEPAAWSAFADVMRTTATQALTAVDQRDLQALYDLTGTLDAPCTSCHSQFWYPGQPAE